MKEKLIVALDVANEQEALALVEQLHDVVGAFKIGMQLFNSQGPNIVEKIQDLGGKVFVDLKLHDIPNTVGQAAKVIADLGAYMFNVHAAGGYDMMRKSVEAAETTAQEKKTVKSLTIAVTVLTSISQEVFENEVGFEGSIEARVVDWAKLAQKAGMDGVVASPKEIEAIREACGQDFVIVTPGVRPVWAAKDDQKRILTPKKAIELGATYLVVGRPITKSADPREAANKIVKEMEEAINA